MKKIFHSVPIAQNFANNFLKKRRKRIEICLLGETLYFLRYRAKTPEKGGGANDRYLENPEE